VRRRAQPAELAQRFFLDRGLGRYTVAQALRAEGLVVETMFERYPETEELLADEVWIREVTAEGLVILMKDDAIRRKPAERAAILDSGAKAFVITNAHLTGQQMASLLVTNRHGIEQRARQPGPYIYGVYSTRLGKLFPRE
jgi:hypothetical protein